jgi:DNA topoisomerase-3
VSTIFITEKPSVAREYLKVLKVNSNNKGGYYEGNSSVMNTNVIITWAVGHLVSICPPEKQDKKWKGKWREIPMPIIPEKFNYEPIKDVKDQYDTVKSLYTRKDIDTIYYAGDSGREGIYIQALIRNQIFKRGNKLNEKVVWIDSFTEQAILSGIKNAKPYSDYESMINSGYMRAISDWLIGMNFTIAFTLNTNELINTGRVVTPTLAMIVDRQSEIDKFVKTDFYGVNAKLGNSVASWKAVEGSKYFDTPMLYNENGLKEKSVANSLISEFNTSKKLKVVKATVQEKKEYPKYLFNLADLQAYCSKVFKITPSKTLEIAQYLYEKKLTTYPRTDSRFLSTAVSKDYYQRFKYEIPMRYVNDAKVSDHYAIIPTFEKQSPNFETDLQEQVYNAILKRFLDTMKPPYVYDSVSITYQHSNGEYFFESFSNVKDYGFMKEDYGEKVDEAVPIPNQGDVVDVSSFTIREMETKPPSAFTTGTLIMAMEKAGKLIDDEELREQIKTCGIGTSATRASIIEKLVSRKFITVSKSQKIEPTDLGKKIIPIVSSFDETLVSPIKTADMEQKLNDIANNKLSSDEFLVNVKSYVSETTSKILNSEKKYLSNNSKGKGGKIMKCPKCQSDVIEGKFGFYCTNRCGMNVSKVFGHELTEEQIESLCNGQKVTYTSNGRTTTVLPTVKENEYNGKTYYNWATESLGGGSTGSSETYTCPNCNESVVKGQYGWYCKGRCGMNINKYFGTELTDEQVKALCDGDEVTINSNGRERTISQPPVKSEWKGKTYYNWSEVKK